MSRPGPLARAAAWVGVRRWRQGVLLLALCLAMFLPGLGATGLSMSEGHRVIPAWEMLDDARAGHPHWLVPRMFGTAYLRKPPGVMWAIAASSAVLGETEFAARLPSAIAATLLTLAVWGFATRWFGSPWGLAAGLAQVLLPVTWPSARSAEIESLHMLTTGLASLLVIDLFARPTERFAGTWARGMALVLAMAAMLWTKGPAGAPVLAGAVVGIMFLAPRRGRRHAGPATLLLACVIAGGAGILILRPIPLDEPVIRQGVEDFLWETGKVGAVLALGPVVLATMLPPAAALLFPWGPDARRERLNAGALGSMPCPEQIARALAWACIASLGVMTIAGVSNPRYGLPVCALVTPLVAYVARGAAGAFVGRRPAIARAMLLGTPFGWPLILLVAAGIYIGSIEPHRRASSGREAGIALAASIPDGAEIWADEMIEARPEVLLYAVREAQADSGKHVRVRWLKPEFMPAAHPPGLLLLLRQDDLVDEVARYTADGRFGTLTPIARSEVHKYKFVLCQPSEPRG